MVSESRNRSSITIPERVEALPPIFHLHVSTSRKYLFVGAVRGHRHQSSHFTVEDFFFKKPEEECYRIEDLKIFYNNSPFTGCISTEFSS
jgi:hypothetical protein